MKKNCAMKSIYTSMLACLILFPAANSAIADTVYIRDTLYVPLRGGQSTEHRILHRGLRSGSARERLETNDDTGYTRVKTDKGLEGWLQSQYLVDEPIASTQLGDINKQLESLQNEHQETLLRLRQEKESGLTSTAAQDDLAIENESLKTELTKITDLAANVIAIEQENKQFNEDRQSLLDEIKSLSEENESLGNSSAQDWFIRGAGTVLIGLLFGFLFGRRIYNRRNTGGWA
jgi:SH3 domain protein